MLVVVGGGLGEEGQGRGRGWAAASAGNGRQGSAAPLKSLCDCQGGCENSTCWLRHLTIAAGSTATVGTYQLWEGRRWRPRRRQHLCRTQGVGKGWPRSRTRRRAVRAAGRKEGKAETKFTRPLE